MSAIECIGDFDHHDRTPAFYRRVFCDWSCCLIVSYVYPGKMGGVLFYTCETSEVRANFRHHGATRV